MSYLIDTNVLSELSRPRPSPRVKGWFAMTPDAELFISVLTVGEIRRGIERLADGPRKVDLARWLDEDVIGSGPERLLPVSLAVAERWALLSVAVQRTLPVVDSFLAATALHHGLKLVTRNAQHFTSPGVEVIDPWRAP